MSISENEFTGGMDAASDQGGPERKRWRGGRRRRRRRGGGGGGGGGGGFGGGQGTNGGGGGYGGRGAAVGGGGDGRPIVEGPTEEATGVLEYTKEGNGWLRKKQNSYLPDSIPNADVFVPSSLIRTHRLQEGSEIRGQAGMPSRGPQRLTMASVEEVGGK